jgi:predicted O-methyltransferase YrrM
MSKISKGLTWIGDIAQILLLDRYNPGRKRASELASTACRALKFRAHCRIPAVEWAELFNGIDAENVVSVTLPGPATDLGDVGDQTSYHAIATLIRALKPKLILETGTYLGVSAYTMALNLSPEAKIVTVDLPDESAKASTADLNQLDQTHVSKSRHRVGEAFLRSPLAAQITQIREDSMTFRAEKHVSNVDLVYVDGGHNTQCITKDTENAFRVLASDGAILWDDYFHLYPDVVAFLDNLSRDYPLRRIPGTNFVFYSRRWKPAIR